jgi:hypothetical protein
MQNLNPQSATFTIIINNQQLAQLIAGLALLQQTNSSIDQQFDAASSFYIAAEDTAAMLKEDLQNDGCINGLCL